MKREISKENRRVTLLEAGVNPRWSSLHACGSESEKKNREDQERVIDALEGKNPAQ